MKLVSTKLMYMILISLAFLSVISWFLFLQSNRAMARRASGGNDIAPAWSACVDYAEEHGNMLPPLDPEPGRLMFDHTVMSTQYGVSGLSVTCEYDETAPVPQRVYKRNPELQKKPELIDDYSWWYLGYAIGNETQGHAFARAYLKRVQEGGRFDTDLSDGPGPETTFKRLQLVHVSKDAKGNTMSDDAIPVFVERPGHYGKFKGGWVVYRDGGRAYIEYPGRFPMSKEFIETLELLDKAGLLRKKVHD